LSGANLFGSDLSSTNLSRGYLLEADLSKTDLSDTDLSGANVSDSILIEPQNYESIKLNQQSNFESAICDRIDFIYYVSNFTPPEHLPIILSNKKELKLILERKIFATQGLESVLRISKLPE